MTAVMHIDVSWEALVMETLRMSTITHTPADAFWDLPWNLYEVAAKEAQEIARKQAGKDG